MLSWIGLLTCGGGGLYIVLQRSSVEGAVIIGGAMLLYLHDELRHLLPRYCAPPLYCAPPRSPYFDHWPSAWPHASRRKLGGAGPE